MGITDHWNMPLKCSAIGYGSTPRHEGKKRHITGGVGGLLHGDLLHIVSPFFLSCNRSGTEQLYPRLAQDEAKQP